MRSKSKACGAVLIVLAVSAALSGCATLGGGRSKDTPRTIGDVLGKDGANSKSGHPNGSGLRDVGEIVVSGVKIKNTKFDYPVVANSRVEHWVDYFTGRGRNYFEKYLDRSEFFVPYITPILKQNGMPE